MNTVTITLNNDDLQALSALLDAGIKAGGLAAVKPAYALLTKLEQAVAAANAKPEPQETE